MAEGSIVLGKSIISLIGGVIMMIIGILLYLGTIGDGGESAHSWGIALIVIGVLSTFVGGGVTALMGWAKSKSD